MADQPELPLPAPPLPDDVPPLPARMINEFVYCPRLACLMWVQQDWADTADTADGRVRHRWSDGPPRPVPDAEGLDADSPPFTVRSLELGSDRLGLVARCDLVEVEDGKVSPVDIKRGRLDRRRLVLLEAGLRERICARDDHVLLLDLSPPTVYNPSCAAWAGASPRCAASRSSSEGAPTPVERSDDEARPGTARGGEALAFPAFS